MSRMHAVVMRMRRANFGFLIAATAAAALQKDRSFWKKERSNDWWENIVKKQSRMKSGSNISV
jgi:hypothetical protein